MYSEEKTSGISSTAMRLFLQLLSQTETQHLMLNYLKPIELFALSMVSDDFYRLISGNSVWSNYLVSPNNLNDLTPYQVFRQYPQHRKPMYRRMRSISDLRANPRVQLQGEQKELTLSANGIELLSITSLSIREVLRLWNFDLMLDLARAGFSGDEVLVLDDLVDGPVPIPKNRLRQLFRDKKSPDEIKCIIFIDSLKFAYRWEANIRWMHLGVTASFFILFCAFYGEASSHDLNKALSQFDGNTPLKPNALTSLIFYDFCEVMENDYDISNCDDITYQYQKRFVCAWLAVLMGAFTGIAAVMAGFRFFSAKCNAVLGFQRAVLSDYFLPGRRHPSLEQDLSSLESPLISATQPENVDYSWISHLLTSNNRDLVLISSPAAIWTLVIIVTLIYNALLDQVDADAVSTLVGAVCSNATNAQWVWDACEKGKYVGDGAGELQSYCADVCDQYDRPLNDEFLREISRAFAPLYVVGALAFLPMCLYYYFTKPSQNFEQHALFARSINPNLLLPEVAMRNC